MSKKLNRKEIGRTKDQKWPKIFPDLSPEKQKINDDFVLHWHKVLPKKYGFIDEFNHNYVVKNAAKNFKRTLEVGCGTGEHLKYEVLNDEQKQNYFALDIRDNMISKVIQVTTRGTIY